VADRRRAWQRGGGRQGKGGRQVVVRCVDQRGDPIRDFHIQLCDGDKPIPYFDDEHVDVYSRDHSYRCFHFDVDKLAECTLPGRSAHRSRSPSWLNTNSGW
jgi:hypothetical protein